MRQVRGVRGRVGGRDARGKGWDRGREKGREVETGGWVDSETERVK